MKAAPTDRNSSRARAPRTDLAARAANVAWKIQADRLERQAADQAAADRLFRRLPVSFGEIDRRFERLEAALANLARLVNDVDDLARQAMEMAER